MTECRDAGYDQRWPTPRGGPRRCRPILRGGQEAVRQAPFPFLCVCHFQARVWGVTTVALPWGQEAGDRAGTPVPTPGAVNLHHQLWLACAPPGGFGEARPVPWRGCVPLPCTVDGPQGTWATSCHRCDESKLVAPRLHLQMCLATRVRHGTYVTCCNAAVPTTMWAAREQNPPVVRCSFSLLDAFSLA